MDDSRADKLQILQCKSKVGRSRCDTQAAHLNVPPDRFFVSNGIGNSIAVYNTTGTLLDTIRN
jgi:hypothetical protein